MKIRHPDGDSIDIDVIDELVVFAANEGPHEICRLAFTGAEVDILIERLQRARRKVKS